MAQTGKVGRLVANMTAQEDTTEIGIRTNKYGDQFIQAVGGERQALADEGSYFIATNPTPDTAIVVTTSITALAETAGAVSVILHHRNTESVTTAGAKRIYPDYIKLICAAVHTTGSSIRYAVTLNSNVASYTSGGSTIVPVNVNTEVANTTIGALHFGALTTAVPATRRLVAKGSIKARVDLAMDQFILCFGAPPAMGNAPVDAAAIMRVVEIAPPVCIGAGWSMALHVWAPATNAAAQYEFEYGFWEK